MITILIRKKNLKEQCHEMSIFWKSKNFNLTFCVCAIVVKVFQKLFIILYNYQPFLTSLKLLTNLKMLTETLLRINSLCFWSLFSSADLSLAKDLTCHRRLPVWFSRITLKHFHCQNHCFRTFEGVIGRIF